MERFGKVSRRNLVLRRSASLVCVLALLTTTLAFSPAFDRLTVSRASEAPLQKPAASKRPINHQDYDSWRSIQASQISRDGKFVAYAFMQQDGDGEIVVRNVASGVEWRAPRGYRPPVPPPDDPSVNIGEVLAAQARLVRPVFTADSRFVVFSIEPTKAEMNKAKKEKKKPEDMPKTGLGIMDVSNGAVTRIEKVKNFQVPEDGSGFIAYLLEPHAGEETGSEQTRNCETGGLARGRPCRPSRRNRNLFPRRQAHPRPQLPRCRFLSPVKRPSNHRAPNPAGCQQPAGR